MRVTLLHSAVYRYQVGLLERIRIQSILGSIDDWMNAIFGFAIKFEINTQWKTQKAPLATSGARGVPGR
jgi:hypothetical protein